MGTTEEEAAALDRINQEAIAREAAALAAADAARKAAEEAANQQNKMVADPEHAAPNWPDDGVQAAPGRLDAVKGALGIGAAGDAALASRLLNDGRPPASAAVAERSGAASAGAKEGTGGARSAKPALGLG